MLHLVNDFTGATELGTLFLHPDHRGGGRGKLLSYSRLMFMAAHREVFGPRLMAELRGWTDEEGRSPFWDAVGRRFFTLDLDEADLLSGREYRFISDLMPDYPIYLSILSDEAQEVVGTPHSGSAPAMAMLGKQGLRYRGYVDIFDAGPSIDAHVDDVDIVRSAERLEVGPLPSDEPSQTRFLAEAGRLASFRVAAVDGVNDGDHLLLGSAQRELLDVVTGDDILTYEMTK